VLRVFTPATLLSYRRALAGISGIEVVPPEGTTNAVAEASAGSFDLCITDRPQDWSIPARARLAVGFVPPDVTRLVGIGTNGTQVVDWRRDAAIFQHVELGDLVVLDQPCWLGEAGEGDLERLGYTAIAFGQRGPLVVRRQDAGGVTHALLFHTDRSTLPYRVGFPILVANAVQVALEQAGLAEVAGRGLLSSHETSLAALERLEFNERLAVKAATAAVKMNRPIWSWLALAALALLLVEWWFYQRKPGGW
jgi:hypothetical protein